MLPLPVTLQLYAVSDEQRLAAYETLARWAEDFAECATREQFFDELTGRAHSLVPFDIFSVWLVDDSAQLIQQAMLTGAGWPVSITEAPLEFGPAGRVVRCQETAILPLVARPSSVLELTLRRAGFRVLGLWPVSTASHQFGIVGLASRDVGEYKPPLVAVVTRLAGTIAQTLERLGPTSRVAADSRQPTEVDRAQLLFRLTSAVTSQRQLPELLRTISTELQQAIPHHYVSLSLWDEAVNGLRRWAVVQPEGSGLVRAEGELLDEGEPPWLAFTSEQAIGLSRAELEAYDATVTRTLVDAGLRSAVYFPLKTSRGKYGVLSVGSPVEDAFPPTEIMLIWQIGRQLAVAIENALYFERAEHFRLDASAKRDRLELLLDINNALVSQLDAPALWASILAAVRQAVDHDYASILIVDPVSRELRVEAATYYDVRGVIEPQSPASLDRSAATLAIQCRAPCVFNGVELDQFDVAGLPSLRGAGLESMCVVPLSSRGSVRGTLNIASRRSDRFTPSEIELLRDIASQVAIAVANTLSFREISDLKNRLTEEKLYLEAEITEQQDFKEIIGHSAALQNVLADIRAVAATDSTVLLLGETGTGKELLARATHDLSQRRDCAFIRFNGASLPTTLVESELFGYEKGAFTGAIQSKIGRLELAHRGTFFFDEVGDVPIEVQPKLLRVLQDREFERLGSTSARRVDIRLIAATNRDLEEMVAGGSFRSDLFYRLSVFPIHVPPLRDRREDIPALVRHFVQRFSRTMSKDITSVPAHTMDALQEWHWPGNIRELQNVVERAVILSPASSLVVPIGALRAAGGQHARRAAATPEAHYQAGERAMILEALRESRGVIAGPAGAAARLGLKRTTLHAKMQKLGIKRP